MKRKIAVFANGWSTEFLRMILDGIRKRAFELNIDIYLFVGYADVRGAMFSDGESNIYRFPELSEFDGAILLPGTFNSEKAVIELSNRVKDAKIPAISVEYQIDGIDFVGTENVEASYALAKHLVEVHNAKRFVYMGGPEDNKDTKERFAGVQKALAEYGIEIPKDCVLNGVYAYKPSKDTMQQWMNSHSYRPDAVICANDDMAIGVCSLFAETGIRVPEDIMVTGYDALRAGQRFMPTLTSVHRSWSNVGAYAVDNIVDKTNGLITNPHVMMETKPVYKESCGCNDSLQDEQFIQDMRGVLVSEHTDSLERVLTLKYISMICNVFEEWNQLNQEDDLSKQIYEVMNSGGKFLGDVFKLFVNQSYMDFKTPQLRKKGYDSKLICICDVDRDGYQKSHVVKRKCFAKELENTAGENHFFIVLPVQKSDECYGVVVFDDCLKYIYDYSFNAIEDNVNDAVKQMRQAALLMSVNEQLQGLSERDYLTGIYNRVAYSRYVDPLMKRLQTEGKDGLLMIVDIDKMKDINDQYGHGQGDVVIRLVANVLVDVLPKDWIVMRYGGDEFQVVGELYEGVTIESAIQDINDGIERYMGQQQEIPFELSVSVGAQIMNASDSHDMQYYFEEADRSMYAMKEIHHNKMKKG